MTGLPDWMQPLMTWITGKPLPHEQATVSLPPFMDMFVTVSVLLGVMGGNLYLLTHSVLAGLLCLPFGWVVSTGLLRKIQVVFGHHCVHRHFVRGKAGANEWVLNFLTTLVLVQNGSEYRHDHLGHHGRTVFTTSQDADAALLHLLGFWPGRTKDALWKACFVALVSPKLHLIFLSSRMRSNFVTRPWAWRTVSLIWASLITVGLASAVGWWKVALVVWLPMFVLYNISALIQFLTEHAWIMGSAVRDTRTYAERCWGRFLGEYCPSSEACGLYGLLQWFKWGARMMLVHAPVRLGCLVGDLPAHDWHHLCLLEGRGDPSAWPVAIFSRQQMIDHGNGFGMEHRELWGLRSMLNHVFSLIESAG